MNHLWTSSATTTFGPAFELVTQFANGSLSFNPVAQEFLNEYADRKVAVVAVVGPYRSGKSYLLNQLIDLDGRARSFSTAHSVQPHTLGIFSYMYEPQRLEDDDERPEVVMFADTTGLFAPSNTEQADARIVALSSLISSVLIYNHLHVVDSQELNRFNFIVQYARGVPRAQEIGNWKDFQADLMWVVRDFFLELKDKAYQEINATEWLFEALDESSSADLRKMFRSVRAYTLPVPMRDRDKLVTLEDHPRDRTPQFKTALANFRAKLLANVRAKRIGDTFMTGSDLVQLIETCIDRLNSDRGIQSINTMETLVAAINEQVLQKAMDRYEEALNQTVFPLKEEDLIQLHQKVLSKEMNRLKKELYSLSNEQRDINAKTLRTRVKRILSSFVNLNNVKCTNLVNQVIENEAMSARSWWDEGEARLPMAVGDIEAEHARRVVESERIFEEKVVKKCLSKNVESFRQNLKSRLDSVLKEVVALNQKIAEAICKEKTESWRVLIDSRLDAYTRESDMEHDFQLMKNDLKKVCVGSVAQKVKAVDKPSRLDYVRRMIELSRQRWKRAFFVLFVICGCMCVIGVQLKEVKFAISVMLLLGSWLVPLAAHPIVRDFTPWDHMDAVFGNFTMLFSALLTLIGENPGVVAILFVLAVPVGFFVYHRNAKKKGPSSGAYRNQQPRSRRQLTERSVERYPSKPDASYGLVQRRERSNWSM